MLRKAGEGNSAPACRRSELEGILWPPVAVGENATLLTLLAGLKASQWLDETELAPRQTLQLAALLKHHAKHSAFFAERFKAGGRRAQKADSLDRLRAIAPLTRAELQAAGAAFFSGQVPRSHMPVATLQSSGSTGEPVRVRKTGVNQLFSLAHSIRDHFWHRRDLSGRLSLITTDSKAYAEYDDWGDPVARLFETGPAQNIPITTDIARQAELIDQFQPDLLVTHANNLGGLLAVWEDRGFGPPHLKHLKSLAEVVSDDLRARARKITGMEIEDVYSSQENGFIAIQCPEGLYHLMSESLIVEILDAEGRPCKEGEIGRVVVTDLHNFASPLIRYVNGDHAEVGPRCSCGRGLPTLRRILGRDRNLLVKPDGRKIWPVVGFIEYHKVAPVRQFQFIQHSLAEIEMKVVTDKELASDQVQALIKLAQATLGQEFDIRVVQTRERLPTKAGKCEEFISRVS